MHVKTIALAAVAGLAVLPSGTSAAILDFSGNICGAAGNGSCGDSSEIGQNYGDIAGQLDVSYRSFNGGTDVTYEPFLKHWAGNYGDLLHVVWGGPGPTVYKAEIIFTPAAGYEVALLSFDGGCYQNRGSCQTLNYAITSLGGSAIDGGATATLFPAHVSVAVNSGYFSDGIKLVWGPDAYDAGLDNILFEVRAIGPNTSPVPEPASWAMLIAGMGIVGASMRRRRTQVRFA